MNEIEGLGPQEVAQRAHAGQANMVAKCTSRTIGEVVLNPNIMAICI